MLLTRLNLREQLLAGLDELGQIPLDPRQFRRPEVVTAAPAVMRMRSGAGDAADAAGGGSRRRRHPSPATGNPGSTRSGKGGQIAFRTQLLRTLEKIPEVRHDYSEKE